MSQQRVQGHAGHAAKPSAGFGPKPLRDSFQFLRGFVRNPAQVGSIIPSSRQLEQRLVRSARLRDARMVVELGPGTGGTTSAFLQAMGATAQLLAIELDTEFHHRLHASLHDPRFNLELGSAERLAEFLSARWLPAPDAIISGIPFSTMPPEVSDRVASTVARVLRPGGRFVAYQVRGHVSGFMSPYLGQPEKSWEVINVPPVRVYTWVKPG
ncbi:MAG: Ribosomal adenine dimethylase domain protein [Polaromonas sp.]|jgi:phosphatidylethanolamine/phosphatidyl-N-methylethanolamine N-methyltransferase|nr:Ribosomal adenine dimethylase domain protein [Polaromonas sp.]